MHSTYIIHKTIFVVFLGMSLPLSRCITFILLLTAIACVNCRQSVPKLQSLQVMQILAIADTPSIDTSFSGFISIFKKVSLPFYFWSDTIDYMPTFSLEHDYSKRVPEVMARKWLFSNDSIIRQNKD